MARQSRRTWDLGSRVPRSTCGSRRSRRHSPGAGRASPSSSTRKTSDARERMSMMRRALARFSAALVIALVLAAPAWSAAAPLAKRLARALASPHIEVGRSAALAVDLTTGKVVFARHPGLALAPASNEQLAVTHAALLR